MEELDLGKYLDRLGRYRDISMILRLLHFHTDFYPHDTFEHGYCLGLVVSTVRNSVNKAEAKCSELMPLAQLIKDL